MYIRPKRTLHDLMWRYRRRRRRISENDGVTESINAADVRERRSDGVCGEKKEMESTANRFSRVYRKSPQRGVGERERIVKERERNVLF